MVLSRGAGAVVRRKEDPRLITGRGTYVDDVFLPGMTYLAFVRSPYAHARILGIDTSAALAHPNAVAVITGEQVREVLAGSMAPRGEVAVDPAQQYIPVQPPLAIDKVRWVGEGVAAVVANDRYAIEDIVDLVQVDYEPLEAIVDPEAALQDGAPKVWDEMPNNISVRVGVTAGDVEAALANAEVIARARIKSQRMAPTPMEPRGIVAAPDAITHGVTVWTSTQNPHAVRNVIAEALGLSQNQVRCIAPEVGGGFGQKIGPYPEEVSVPAVAMMLQVPVKWIETRSENFIASSQGRNQFMDIEVAGTKEGRITALRGRGILDSGAYPKSLDLASLTLMMAAGCYDIDNLDYSITGVYTNTMANGAYRGAGRPEAAYYVERAVDLFAAEAGLDPVEVRRKNFISRDKFPYATHTGLVYDTGDYEKALNKALEVAGYADLRKQQEELRLQGRYIGIGVASYVEICGFGPYESATVRVEPGGEVSIFTGISPHGQGQETTFAQLAVEYLGVDFDKVQVFHGDTSNTPPGIGTMGSRGLAVGGAALMMAIETIREKASRITANHFEASVDDIEFAEGKFRVKGVPERGLTLAEVAAISYSAPSEDLTGLQATEFFRPENSTFPFGTHIAVAEVFPETGAIKLLRYVSVDDCGKIISPLLVTGQVHGGLAQGIGQALLEELYYDESGEPIGGTLNDYALPRAENFPPFETYHTETTTFINPLGAKGIGEAATIGATPATANAVMDALRPFGIRHLDIPLTPEKVWQAIQEHTENVGVAAD